MIKRGLKRILKQIGFEVKKIDKTSQVITEPEEDEFNSVPDREMYTPLFCPTYKNGKGEFKEIVEKMNSFTLVSADRCHILYTLAKQLMNVEGEFSECGVYKGGTAVLLAEVINNHKGTYDPSLHLYDTFEGMPETDKKKDWHEKGDFSDTSLESVKARLQNYSKVLFYKGYIPSTFSENEHHKIAFAHIDVDIYKSIIDCCNFIYPRMSVGGMFVFYDYVFITCPGARSAVDD